MCDLFTKLWADLGEAPTNSQSNPVSDYASRIDAEAEREGASLRNAPRRHRRNFESRVEKAQRIYQQTQSSNNPLAELMKDL